MKKVYTLFTIAALGAAIVTEAFATSEGNVATKKKSERRETLVQYQFNEDTDAELSDPDNWTDVTNTTPQSCGDPGTLPCVIEFDSESHADIEEFLEDYQTKTEIMDNSRLVSSKQESTNP